MSTPEYPFCAVVGQSQFKLALKLLAIDAGIGGLLVSGPRGTAKSTLARGLSSITPSQGGFVTLPLAASEEMLVGTLDLQKVLDNKEVAFSPGLLAKADQGILYVDEVNLLADNLVDLLLDVAASGVNRIERDGISHSHAARFILLGTMNPDEGELRPQLQDRFGLAVNIESRFSAAQRVDIVRRREAFDRDPRAFIEQFASQQTELRSDLKVAIDQLSRVECPDAIRVEIAERCIAANVDGLRADIVWHRTAVAHAALAQKSSVDSDDLDAVEDLVLNHRRNNDGSRSSSPPQSERDGQAPSEGHQDDTHGQGGQSGDWGQMKPVSQITATESRFEALAAHTTPTVNQSRTSDSYTRLRGSAAQGPAAGRMAGPKINWFQTLVASFGDWPLRVFKHQRQRSGNPVLHIILLDTSASTLRNNRFGDAKAAILKIAEQAYLAREQVTILGFGNQRVQTLLPRKRAPRALRRLLDEIEAGGGTPLRLVLEQARHYQAQIGRSNPGLQLRNYLLTDGKSSASLEGLDLLGETLLVDLEASRVKRGRGVEIAASLGARYLPLPVS
ncbi:MAG: magnesium chelatase subunit D [Planctomycetota bacterium]|jgi:magnesium chelatase subunit D